MDLKKLAKRYLEAWNQHDVDALLSLMHEGAAYYDAFWRETCVGRDLRQYFTDSFEEDPFTYRLIGDFIDVENAVLYRYSVHNQDVAKGRDAVFEGADVLTVVDEKIMTVSEFYCHPSDEAIEDVAHLEIHRHGQTRYATSGLATCRSLALARQLGKLFENRRKSDNDDMTAAELARQLGCSLDHFFQVVERIINSDTIGIDSQQKADLANQLLRKDSLQN